MMSVTITNLGFGDFTPSNWISRLLVSTLALFGIFQTALIVGVLSEALVIPPEEKRILASLEKQRLEKIRRNTAASLIQWAWRVYVFDQSQLGHERHVKFTQGILIRLKTLKNFLMKFQDLVSSQPTELGRLYSEFSPVRIALVQSRRKSLRSLLNKANGCLRSCCQ